MKLTTHLIPHLIPRLLAALLAGLGQAAHAMEFGSADVHNSDD
jgi:hypothetical protein